MKYETRLLLPQLSKCSKLDANPQYSTGAVTIHIETVTK